MQRSMTLFCSFARSTASAYGVLEKDIIEYNGIKDFGNIRFAVISSRLLSTENGFAERDDMSS